MLKAVFFDLDDTLCDDAGAWLSSALGAAQDVLALALGDYDASALAAAFLEISERYWMSMAPVTETRALDAVRTEQWLEALRETGGSSDPKLARLLAEDYGRRRSTGITLFPDVLPTLRALKARGLCLALITNGVQMTHVEKVAFLGLESEFDHVLIADAVGYFKPDSRIFNHALKLCGCQASEAAMVGDNLVNDIEGAQAVGIRAYWYNPRAEPLPQGALSPQGGDVQSLSELIARLL
jgi:putative hydrolase of the HAD superfamily